MSFPMQVDAFGTSTITTSTSMAAHNAAVFIANGSAFIVGVIFGPGIHDEVKLVVWQGIAGQVWIGSAGPSTGYPSNDFIYYLDSYSASMRDGVIYIAYPAIWRVNPEQPMYYNDMTVNVARFNTATFSWDSVIAGPEEVGWDFYGGFFSNIPENPTDRYNGIGIVADAASDITIVANRGTWPDLAFIGSFRYTGSWSACDTEVPITNPNDPTEVPALVATLDDGTYFYTRYNSIDCTSASLYCGQIRGGYGTLIASDVYVSRSDAGYPRTVPSIGKPWLEDGDAMIPYKATSGYLKVGKRVSGTWSSEVVDETKTVRRSQPQPSVFYTGEVMGTNASAIFYSDGVWSAIWWDNANEWPGNSSNQTLWWSRKESGAWTTPVVMVQDTSNQRSPHVGVYGSTVGVAFERNGVIWYHQISAEQTIIGDDGIPSAEAIGLPSGLIGGRLGKGQSCGAPGSRPLPRGGNQLRCRGAATYTGI